MRSILYLALFCFFNFSAHASLQEIFGNLDSGDRCVSDYECSSLCCNSNTGVCSPHDPSANPPILCNKSSGQSCVTSEFCKGEYVPVCKIVKIGTNPDGTAACVRRCPEVELKGRCVKNRCLPPLAPPIPSLDPENCANAEEP